MDSTKTNTYLSPGKIDLLLQNFAITIPITIHGKDQFCHVTKHDQAEYWRFFVPNLKGT